MFLCRVKIIKMGRLIQCIINVWSSSKSVLNMCICTDIQYIYNLRVNSWHAKQLTNTRTHVFFSAQTKTGFRPRGLGMMEQQGATTARGPHRLPAHPPPLRRQWKDHTHRRTNHSALARSYGPSFKARRAPVNAPSFTPREPSVCVVCASEIKNNPLV